MFKGLVVPIPRLPAKPLLVEVVCRKLEFTVRVALVVSPEVAVISPEIVGVAVQLVEPKVVVTPDRPKVTPVAFVPPTVKDPAESKAKVPDVAVEIVRLPLVFVQLLVPPEAMTKVPVELPMLVALVPVALTLPVPVTVIPPVP